MTTPFIINLKLGPFERFVEGGGRGYDEWEENHAWLFGPAMIQIAEYVKTYEEFPPRQSSFSPKEDDLMSKINQQPGK